MMDTKYKEILFTTCPSPIGNIIVSTDNKYVTSIHISGDRYFKRIPPAWIKDRSNELLNETILQLDDYFKGKSKAFNLPILLKGTKFQVKVWKFLATIPYASTVSYKDVAIGISNTYAYQAVGTAVGKNKFPIVIPCHRVIKEDGSIGQFASGSKKKEFLLNLEREYNNGYDKDKKNL